MTNTILIEKDGYVWIVSRDKRKSIRHGLGLLGTDLKVEDRRVEVPYEELVERWLKDTAQDSIQDSAEASL